MASAKPGDDAAVVGAPARGATAETTPEVPTETTTSPGRARSPRAAAMLSPVPGPDAAATRPAVRPGGLGRPERPGAVTASCPRAAAAGRGR